MCDVNIEEWEAKGTACTTAEILFRNVYGIVLYACRFPGEVDLHRVVAARLLPVLTRRPNICACLPRLDAWHALVQAFADQAPPVRALAGPTARALARALTAAAAGAPDRDAAGQHVSRLLCNIAGACCCLKILSLGHAPSIHA